MNRADYKANVCGQLGQAKHVCFKEVSIGDWHPKVAHCHKNVDYWVKKKPNYIAVRGWVTCAQFSDGSTCLTAHSVVQGPDGKLLDITPLEGERTRKSIRKGMRFITHIGDERTFFEIKEMDHSFNCPCAGGTE